MKYLVIVIVLFFTGCGTLGLKKGADYAGDRLDELRENADNMPMPDIGSAKPVSVALGWVVYLGGGLVVVGCLALVASAFIPVPKSAAFSCIFIGSCMVLAVTIAQEYFFEVIAISGLGLAYWIGEMRGRMLPQERFSFMRKRSAK